MPGSLSGNSILLCLYFVSVHVDITVFNSLIILHFLVEFVVVIVFYELCPSETPSHLLSLIRCVQYSTCAINIFSTVFAGYTFFVHSAVLKNVLQAVVSIHCCHITNHSKIWWVKMTCLKIGLRDSLGWLC